MQQGKAFLAWAALSIVAVTVCAEPVRAQMSPDLIMETYNSNINGIISSHINNLSIDNIVRGKAHFSGSSKGSHHSKKRESPPAAHAAMTTYSSSPTITQGLRDELIAKVQMQSPKDGASVSKLLKQYNFVTIWQGIVAPYGLKRNDVADSVAAYLVLGWMAANDVKNVTPAQARSVRNQMKTTLGAMPAFARSSSADKQRIAESLMLEFVLRQGAAQKAEQSGDSNQLRQLAAAYQARVQRTLGLNLRNLSLTTTGFRAK